MHYLFFSNAYFLSYNNTKIPHFGLFIICFPDMLNSFSSLKIVLNFDRVFFFYVCSINTTFDSTSDFWTFIYLTCNSILVHFLHNFLVTNLSFKPLKYMFIARFFIILYIYKNSILTQIETSEEMLIRLSFYFSSFIYAFIYECLVIKEESHLFSSWRLKRLYSLKTFLEPI